MPLTMLPHWSEPHPHRAAVAAVQFHEVVGLEDHVVELQERQFLVALEPHADAVHGHHPVDGEMPADVAQHLDVVELRQPRGVVDHGGGVADPVESKESRKRLLDAGLVLLDLIEGEDLSRFVAAGRVADPGGAAAHEGDGRAARGLEPVQHHDRQEVADMERGRRAIVAHIGGEPAFQRRRVDAGQIRALVDEAAIGQHPEEFRFRREGVGRRSGHGRFRCQRIAKPKGSRFGTGRAAA